MGKRFRNEVASVLETIFQDPLMWRERSFGYRRVNCDIFPYDVAYVMRGSEIVVLAVAASSCEPGYWYERVEIEEN